MEQAHRVGERQLLLFRSPLTNGALVAVAVLFALLTVGPAAAAKPCWKQVQDDWVNDRLSHSTYPTACYEQAIKKLQPDVRYYSSAAEDIQAAKERVLRENARFPASSTSGSDGSSSPLTEFLNWGPSAADEVPLPLLTIAFLALVLIGAAAAGLVNRRFQSRRVPPDRPNDA